MAEVQEVFELLPIEIDATTKTLRTPSGSRALRAELEALNSLHRTLTTTLDGSGASGSGTGAGGVGVGATAAAAAAAAVVPPAPVPVNPKRSANVNRLRESGNEAYKKGRYGEAVKFYSLGLQMALTRPGWEPQQLVREEVAALYANRAQAHMALQGWAEGAVDAEASVEAKRVGNSKAWWRRGKCLLEMCRYDEAQAWVSKGLEMEGEEAELVALLKEIRSKKSHIPEKA